MGTSIAPYDHIAAKIPDAVEKFFTARSLGSSRCSPARANREPFMFEPTHERGAPPRMRFATCRSARALSDGVPDILVVCKEHRAATPETVDPEVVGDVRGSWFDDRITRKDRMISRIALDRAMQQTIVT